MSAQVGNLYDKYGTRNPAARALVARWRAAVDELVVAAGPDSVLDLGCGEGVLTADWARSLPGARVLGVDVADAVRVVPPPNAAFGVVEPAPPLPFPDASFDLVTAVESLEHMDDAEAALAEMARCARRHLLVSVPREPLWRMLNVVRGAHLRRLGDTPGHVRHLSRGGLRRLLAPHGAVVALRSPLPWTVALVRV